MIELAIRPFSDGMTSRAGRGSRRETRGDVVRHAATKGRRAVPSLLVTAHAVRGVQRVVVADMARHAGSRRWRGVRACERESRQAVVEGSRVPTLGRVAVRAIGRGKRRTGS